jgi:hypothetical protein
VADEVTVTPPSVPVSAREALLAAAVIFGRHADLLDDPLNAEALKGDDAAAAAAVMTYRACAGTLRDMADQRGCGHRFHDDVVASGWRHADVAAGLIGEWRNDPRHGVGPLRVARESLRLIMALLGSYERPDPDVDGWGR